MLQVYDSWYITDKKYNERLFLGLMIANTDTKHYLDLTDAVYRFMPSVLTPEDTKRIHGFNERLGVKSYENTINYFYHLMRNADAARIETEKPHSEL